MPAQPLSIRLFVEAIEWPVISAMVSINPNSPATATIQVVPADSVMDIKPRSLVFLFFHDYWQGRSTAQGLSDVAKSVEVEEIPRMEDAMLGDYRLLFAGEVVGVGYQKTAGGRSMTLSCMDFSVYWDTCWYFKGCSIFGIQGKGAWADGAGSTLHDVFMGTGEMIYKVLKEAPLGYIVHAYKNKDDKRVVESQIPGLLGGIVGLLQAIGGIYKGGNKKRGVSKFFALSELRLKLSQQLGVYADDSPLKLMKRAGFGAIWDKAVKGLGKQFNFRMAVTALSRYIFYEVYPNPAARYIQPTGVFAGGPAPPCIVKGHPLYGEWALEAERIATSIANWRDRCGNTEVTVSKVELRGAIEKLQRRCYTWGKDAQGQVKKVAGCFLGAKKKMADALKVINTRGNVETGPFWRHMDKAETKLGDIINTAVPDKRLDVASSRPEFLYSQLFRPDLWFCSPPRCNVLFPDQYDSLSYNRNFLQEVTRLLLKTPNTFSGYDAMWDKYVYAPQVLGITKEKKLIRKEEGLPLHVMRDLMEHELYTGVIPKQEKAKGLKVFGIKGNIAQEGQYKVGYMQRLANFLFYKYRFSTRTLSVTGPFNPFVVAGFPAIVLDRPTNKETQRNLFREFTKNRKQYAREAQESDVLIHKGEGPEIESMYSGTHYLGEIVSITHQLSQSGGKTAITMGYARTHRENVDPVGTDLSEDQIRKYKKGTNREKVNYVAAYQKPAIGGRGLYGGTITYVREMDRETLAKNWPGEYWLLGTSQTRKRGVFITKVPVGVKKKAREFGTEAIAKAGSPDAIIEFGLYHIKEDMWKEADEGNLKIPFEVSVRPAWYGNCWLNEQIGAVYQQLLGIGAVTDPMSIGNTGIVSTTSVDDMEFERSLAGDNTELDFARSMTDEGLEAVSDKDTATAEDTAAAQAVMALEANASIEDAVNYLNLVYSHVKTENFNADSFIHAYAWRPIATLTEIMGTTNLTYDPETGKVTSGVEGFFSRAFGDYKDLFLLVDEEVRSILGIFRGEEASSRLDVRRERRLASIAYVSEILSRGIRG